MYWYLYLVCQSSHVKHGKSQNFKNLQEARKLISKMSEVFFACFACTGALKYSDNEHSMVLVKLKHKISECTYQMATSF